MDKLSTFKKIIVGITLLGVVTAIAITIARYDNSFNSIDLEPTVNIVHNYTQIAYLDTLAHTALEAHGIEGQTVSLFTAPNSTVQRDSGGFRLNAYVTQPVVEDTYSMFLSPDLSRRQYISAVSHEVIHIGQYDSGRLVSHDGIVIFEGDTVSLYDIPYSRREWEEEAFKNGPILEKKVREKLYD